MREPMLMVLLVSYGFGIVNTDGEPGLNEADDGTPFKVVELFFGVER